MAIKVYSDIESKCNINTKNLYVRQSNYNKSVPTKDLIATNGYVESKEWGLNMPGGFYTYSYTSSSLGSDTPWTKYGVVTPLSGTNTAYFNMIHINGLGVSNTNQNSGVTQIGGLFGGRLYYRNGNQNGWYDKTSMTSGGWRELIDDAGGQTIKGTLNIQNTETSEFTKTVSFYGYIYSTSVYSPTKFQVCIPGYNFTNKPNYQFTEITFGADDVTYNYPDNIELLVTQTTINDDNSVTFNVEGYIKEETNNVYTGMQVDLTIKVRVKYKLLGLAQCNAIISDRAPIHENDVIRYQELIDALPNCDTWTRINTPSYGTNDITISTKGDKPLLFFGMYKKPSWEVASPVLGMYIPPLYYDSYNNTLDATDTKASGTNQVYNLASGDTIGKLQCRSNWNVVFVPDVTSDSKEILFGLSVVHFDNSDWHKDKPLRI